MDKFGYEMDISNSMKSKLGFSSVIYQQITQPISIIDTFKGSWKALEGQQSSYLVTTRDLYPKTNKSIEKKSISEKWKQ